MAHQGFHLAGGQGFSSSLFLVRQGAFGANIAVSYKIDYIGRDFLHDCLDFSDFVNLFFPFRLSGFFYDVEHWFYGQPFLAEYISSHCGEIIWYAYSSRLSQFLLRDRCEELHHAGFRFFGRLDDLHEVVISVGSDVFDDRLLLRSWEFHRVDYDCGVSV